MKRMWKVLPAALLAVGIVMSCAFASDGRGKNFVDTDGDGVCDNAGERECPQPGWIDTDGDGVCDNAGERECPRKGQDDGDGGLGQNCEQSGHGPQGHGRGCGHVKGTGKGHCRKG